MTFQNVIYDINHSFQRVLDRAEGECDALLMVGGFSESPYLRKMLREKNATRNVISIDDGTKKAAAEGASLWYLRQTVVARASRSFFGTNMTTPFDQHNTLHKQREHTKFTVRSSPLPPVFVHAHPFA